MRLFLFSLIILTTTWQHLPAQTALSSRVASYDISVILNTENKTLDAKQVLHWTNPSEVDTVSELRFHVYLNAFKNNQSTYLSGGGGFGEIDESYDTECLWGYTKFKEIKDAAGNDLTAAMQYIQPDDDNKYDETVLSLPLHTPVLPGETVDIFLEWEAKIPKTISRVGYGKNFHFLVQWFPKVGVYEPAGMRFSEEGNWNCHQYHAPTEYYSDFGLYNVDITVPKDYVVGASGYLIKKEEQGKQTTHYYQAADVIDFAWTASPNFIETKDQWEDVELSILSYPAGEVFAPRILNAAKNSLEYLHDFVGEYPYPKLTVVSPPYHGLKSSAMEYPTLVTTFALNGLPEGMRSTETLTVHETIHQYFMQMIATNEQEEAWLDEGFTSYFEAKIMDKYYGGFFYDSYFDINIGSQELRRGRFYGSNNIKLQPLSKPTYLTEGGSHRELSYGKAAVVLWTLEGLLGEATMREIMRAYFQKWKFKHPCGDDFVDIVNEVVLQKFGTEKREEIALFLDQAIYGTEECDYALAGIGIRSPGNQRGIFKGDCLEEPTEWRVKPYTSYITIYRLGEIQVPIDIVLTYENGETELREWDGKDRVKVLEVANEARVIAAEIDPERKIYLDQNFINNSYTRRPEKKGIAKTTRTFFTWLQNTLTSLSWLV